MQRRRANRFDRPHAGLHQQFELIRVSAVRGNAGIGAVGDLHARFDSFFKRSARQAWERCVALRPGFTLESFAAESLYEKPADVEHWLDGLRKTGLGE